MLRFFAVPRDYCALRVTVDLRAQGRGAPKESTVLTASRYFTSERITKRRPIAVGMTIHVSEVTPSWVHIWVVISFS